MSNPNAPVQQEPHARYVVPAESCGWACGSQQSSRWVASCLNISSRCSSLTEPRNLSPRARHPANCGRAPQRCHVGPRSLRNPTVGGHLVHRVHVAALVLIDGGEPADRRAGLTVFGGRRAGTFNTPLIAAQSAGLNPSKGYFRKHRPRQNDRSKGRRSFAALSAKCHAGLGKQLSTRQRRHQRRPGTAARRKRNPHRVLLPPPAIFFDPHGIFPALQCFRWRETRERPGPPEVAKSDAQNTTREGGRAWKVGGARARSRRCRSCVPSDPVLIARLAASL